MGEILYFRLRGRGEECAVLPRLKPHYIYFVLASFAVLIVGAGLLVSRTIMNSYREAVAANAGWNERLVAFSRLAEHAEAVDAPGNDVFVTHDPATEERRMAVALNGFNEELAELRAEIAANLPHEKAAPLLARLEAARTGMHAVTAEAELIFAHLKAGRLKAASERMASMDRKYAVVTSGLAELRHFVARLQQKNFEEQMATARTVERSEYLLGALMLLLVAAATVFGVRLAKQLSSDSARTQVVFRREIEANEQKQKSLARELHEDLGQMLASLKMHLELLRMEPQSRNARVDDVNRIAEGALHRLLDMVRDLTPHGMEDLGLAPVLAAHVQDWTQGSGLRVHFTQSMLERRAPPNIETAAYRIAGELVRNAVRHSHGDTLNVEVRQSETELHLYVEDNGVGFDVAAAMNPGGGERLGLASLRERVSLLGGSLQVASQPGGGTAVHAVLPTSGVAAAPALPAAARLAA
jgi:signal transduction histidine kinase